jgi:hypothetical protein
MNTSIKKIYCLGSSFTAGGGFEYDSDFRKVADRKRYELYKPLGEEMSLFNFSWPGQLQNILNYHESNIIVDNIAKQGYGNHRTERLIYEITNDIEFKKDETLFLIEFTGLGRDEWFSNEINDYIICNYNVKTDKEFIFSGIAKDYFYQTREDEKKLNAHTEFFNKIITEFKNVNYEVEKLHRDIHFFLSYLELNNINYLITSPPPDSLKLYDYSKCIYFGDGKFFEKTNSFVDFFYKNKLSITDETYSTQVDGHAGFKANKMIANIIYNSIIDKKLIYLPKKEIDWKYFYELEIINKDKIFL